MATVLTHDTRPTVGAAVWTGRVLSGLAIAFLAMDAGGKLIAPAMMIANSPPLGLPDSPAFYQSTVDLVVCQSSDALFHFKMSSGVT